MKQINFLLLTVVSLSCSSCSSGNSAGSASGGDSVRVAAPAYDNALAKGTVTDSVVCTGQPGLCYALYLPSNYTSAKPFPCIYFFDAHARGAMPLNNYKALAEKYGFVLVGSNTSRNGLPWQANNAAIKSMLEDTRARVNIDPKQIYTSGFSGGSRVAASIAIEDGGVAGVIGCAAGFPAVETGIQSRFNYFGIVGDYDFNLTEMEQLDITLEQNGFTHQLLVSAGIHGWPSEKDFEAALLWQEVNAMKENRQQKNEAVVAALNSDYRSRIKVAVASSDLENELRLLDGAVGVLGAMADVSGLKKQIAPLATGAAYSKAIGKQVALQKEELIEQHELASRFASMNEEWWAKKIAGINQSIKKAGNGDEAKMYHRLLNYLGLVAYMNTTHAINTGDLDNATAYLKIFRLADPKNPDVSYLSAICFMKKGDAGHALSSLKEAADMGYSEVATLTTEQAFASLLNTPDFKAVLEKIKGNAVH